MATSVAAYKQSFGFDAPPYTYRDFEESDVIVLVGSNLCIAHPILWQRVLRNRRRPEIIVIDPRKTETAMAATQHYPIRPKSDLTLLYGLAQCLIAMGAVRTDFIRAHTTGFDDFRRHVGVFTIEATTAATGLSGEEILRLAETIRGGERVSFWWTMGVNQGHEATRTAQAIINLALMTGNIGRPGTGANSITGQCNAMGSRLFSNTSSLVGGRDFGRPEHRVQVAEIMGIEPGCIPDRESWAYDQIIDGIENGPIKGLWIVGTNSLHSWIGSRQLERVFERLEFLVVQDMYHTTETARRADLILPAAGWGEKAGTFINSERRLGLLQKIRRAPGTALSDFNIFRLVARYWGCEGMFEEWRSPEAAFQILKRLSQGRPCDITGIRDYRMLEECGGIQWPFPNGSAVKRDERRLFEDGRFYHPDGKARFLFDMPRPAVEEPCLEYPFWLLTGRGTSAQWHTQTRTGKSDLLRQLHPKNVYVEMNPDDARRIGVGPGGKVRIVSRRGELRARVVLTHTVQPGQVFVPMHYPETNRLTCPSFDPHSRQPSYKAGAVTIQCLTKGGLGDFANP